MRDKGFNLRPRTLIKGIRSEADAEVVEGNIPKSDVALETICNMAGCKEDAGMD
jgi:hypothetical protein